MEKTMYENLLHEVTELIRNEVKTETIVGEPFELGEFTCVPVMRLGLGLGAGGGEGTDKNKASGTGGGAGGGFGVDRSRKTVSILVVALCPTLSFSFLRR